MDDKVFIPLSIESTSVKRQNYFTSGSKGLILVLSIVPAFIWIPYLTSLTKGSIMGMILGTLSYLIVFSFVLRFTIFEEGRFRQIFYSLNENKVSSYKYFWGIDRIDDNGIIHYSYEGKDSIRKAFVIKLIRGNIVGKGSSYARDFRETMRKIKSFILGKGVIVEEIQLSSNKGTPENIKHMYRNVKKIKNQKAKELAQDHVNNIAFMARHSKQLETVYLVIIFEDALKFKFMESMSQTIVSIAKSSGFFKIAKQIEKYEVENFIEDYLAIRGIKSFEFPSEIKPFDNYCTVESLYDSDGNEEWFDKELIYKQIKEYKGTKFGKLVEEEQNIENEISEEMKKEEAKQSKKAKKVHNKLSKGRMDRINAYFDEDEDEDEDEDSKEDDNEIEEEKEQEIEQEKE